MAKKRITKEQWLQAALDFVIERGVFGMTPEQLAKSLGTSRSSYYWHFGGREKFRAEVVDYWVSTYTDAVAERLAQFRGTPEGRLNLLVELIQDEDLTRYEGAVYALACGNPDLMSRIRRTYKFRFEYVRSILAETGIKPEQLESVSGLLVSYLTWSDAMDMGGISSREMRQSRSLTDLLAN